MTIRSPRPGARRAAAGALLGLLAVPTLTACTGSEEPAAQNDQADTDGDGTVTPEEVMAYAKEQLDATTGVALSLETADEPAEGDFLQSATGTITRQPAFAGTIAGRVSGIPASDVEVIAVDDEVHVEVPVVGWQTVDPADFCAPNPADLIDPDTGVSNVLTAAEDVEAGEAERGGTDNEEILTPYTGSVPGDAIREILPCAEGDAFDAAFRVDGDGRLTGADITGAFFPGTDDITYSLAISEYDVEREITAP